MKLHFGLDSKLEFKWRAVEAMCRQLLCDGEKEKYKKAFGFTLSSLYVRLFVQWAASQYVE